MSQNSYVHVRHFHNFIVHVRHFHNFIIKKPYVCTIIGSSGRDFVLMILFRLYGSKAGLFEGSLLVYSE